MSICSKCNAGHEANESICPSCGAPATNVHFRCGRIGIFALKFTMLISIIGAILGIVIGIIMLLRGDYWDAALCIIVGVPVAFCQFVAFGLAIEYARRE